MKNIKKFSLSIISIIITIIFVSLFLTILYYFDYISTDTYKFFKIGALVITLIVNSIILGRNSIKNGYLDGIKLGILLILFCTFVTIVQKKISIHLIIYNVIILISTTLGSMIGINTKKIEKN
ncbi:MAG: TIGR04086 family membrane protein [Bacilli bacterium]|nr:TIGR04086 family membrane protein [Bacilli bacterium]